MISEWQVCPVCRQESCKSALNISEELLYYRCSICHLDALSKGDEQSRKSWFLKQQHIHYADLSDKPSLLSREIEAAEIKTRIDTIKNHLTSDKRICEVGPGTGEFARALEQLNYSVTVVEQANSYKALRNKLEKVEVVNGDFSELKNLDLSFDAICTFHVIEHVPDLLEHLNKACSFSRPNGLLFIATPNADSLLHKMPFNLSPHYDDAHMVVLSQKSLMQALDATGWEPIEVKTNEYLVYWLRVLTKITRRVKNKNEQATAGQYINNSGVLILLAFKALNWLILPFLKTIKVFGMGSELFIVARKKSNAVGHD